MEQNKRPKFNTEKHPLSKTQNVLNRMRKAFEKGRGIFIKPDELQEMSLSFFGDLWSQTDPNLKSLNIVNLKENKNEDSDYD